METRPRTGTGLPGTAAATLPVRNRRRAETPHPTVPAVALTDILVPVDLTDVAPSGDIAETPQSTAGPDVIPTSVSAGN